MANFEQVLVLILVAILGFLMHKINPTVTNEQKINEHSEENLQLRDKGKREEAVAFSVYAPSKTHYQDEEVLIFSSIRVDTHSAYNTKTGMFTAPLDGTYYFAATTCTGHKECVVHGILHDNRRLASSCICAMHSCTSSSAVVYLKKNEIVWVQILALSILSDDHHRKSSFSGYLIGP